MRDAEATVARLRRLKELGVMIAIDDFGTGYSSLAYLRQFPVDVLKIDRSFVAEMDGSHDSAALVHTLVELGRTLGLTTLAEGIEDDSQLEILRAERCESGAGLLLLAAGRPRVHRGAPHPIAAPHGAHSALTPTRRDLLAARESSSSPICGSARTRRPESGQSGPPSPTTRCQKVVAGRTRS